MLADFLVNMSASADVLAMAKVEVDLSAIPEGKNVRIIYYGYQLKCLDSNWI
jgi:ubiquinol-cytochrome c reductase iron-sulfur subunit